MGALRPPAVLAAGVWLALAGCGGNDPYELVIQFRTPELAAAAEVIEVAIVEACEAQGQLGEAPVEPRETFTLVRGESMNAPGGVGLLPLGAYARARNESCEVIAAGCADRGTEDTGDLVVTVDSVAGTGCASGEHCVGGACVPNGPEDVIALDDFTRTVAGGWGTALVGGSWFYKSGEQPSFSTMDGLGLMNVPVAGESRIPWLDAVSERDVDISASVSTDTAAGGTYGYSFALGVRRLANHTYYLGSLRFVPDGSMRLLIQKFTGSSEGIAIGTDVALAGSTWSAGKRFHLRFSAAGANPTALRLRAWEDGQPEPTTWQLTEMDSEALLQVPGAVAVYGYLGSSSTPPIVYAIDDLLAIRP